MERGSSHLCWTDTILLKKKKGNVKMLVGYIYGYALALKQIDFHKDDQGTGTFLL